jgi:hypothetical protein
MSFARYIHVPRDRETIQEAVDIASNGDVVLIHPGTYRENIVIDGDIISLAGLYHTTGDVDTLTFEITSIGSNPLQVTRRQILPLDPPNVQGFYIVDDFDELVLEQDSTFVTQVIFAPPFAAEYEGSLCIQSNDIDNPTLFVPILGTSLNVKKEDTDNPHTFEESINL